MTRHLTLIIVFSAISLFSANLKAEETSTQAYALMQDCLAEGMGVIDNGSYERFCIDHYLATDKLDDEKDRSTQNR